MKRERSITSIILTRVIGFIIFIILLLGANFAISYVPSNVNPICTEIVNFFNLNLVLFILLLFLDILSGLFWNFNFPFNLLAPMISSIFGIFNVALLYNMWTFADQYINSGIPIPIYAIYILVAIIVFVCGYVRIFVNLEKTKKETEKRYGNELKEIKKLSRKKKSNLEWLDVKGQLKVLFYNIEEQLKVVLYNVVDALNKVFEKEKRESKGKKKRRK